MPVLNHACAGPLGSGGVEGSFLSSATLFLVFLRQLCRRCSTTCFLEYHFFAHSPRGEVGGGGVVFSPVWFFSCLVFLLFGVAGPPFPPGFAPLSHKLLACAAYYTQFRLFVSVLTLCPPASSPPPLLTLVFSPAVSSVPGTAAPRYSPTKTHMHFQTDEEEEEEEEEVKKRVCVPGRPPQPELLVARTGTGFTAAHLVELPAAAAVCLGDRFWHSPDFSHFFNLGISLFLNSF